MGEEGIKNSPKNSDVFNGRPLLSKRKEWADSEGSKIRFKEKMRFAPHNSKN
jgi:hypothetical protein